MSEEGGSAERAGRPRTRTPPRARLPPLSAAALHDSSDDSAVRYASRQYRSQQAKRRRRAKAAAERGAPETERGAPEAASDSADAADTHRSRGGADDSGGGDSTSRRELGPLAATTGDETAEPSIADELSRLGEELRSGSEAGGEPAPRLAPEPLPHPPVTKLFVEKGSRFQAEKRTAAARAAGAAYARKSQACAVDLAVQTQRVFAPLGRLCYGLLAGAAVCHFMFVLAMARRRADAVAFIARYAELALPFRALFSALCTVSAVAVLDRYDVARASAAALRQALTLQDGGVAVPLYLAALGVCAALAPLDDRLRLYGRSRAVGDVWPSRAAAADDVQVFVALCGARAALLLAAWLVVAANPALDRVLEYLRRLPATTRPAAGEQDANVSSVA